MWLFKKNRKISINYLVEKKNIYTFANAKNKWPVRLSVRTQDFHSCKRGSIPLRAT